jgi:hypothetical protein
MRSALLALAGVVLALSVHAETGAVLRMDFSNPALSPSQWTLVLHPDGSGHFNSKRGTPPTAERPVIDAPDVDRDIQLSAEFASRVFQTVRRHRFLNERCDSLQKVAFQGLKKIAYTGPDGQGACEFNYSKDKEIQALSDSLVAVASTIVEGARLELLRHHDPLGLDSEMDYIADAVHDGRLQQIGAIRGLLERLEEDSGVMERVRKRARELLAQADK